MEQNNPTGASEAPSHAEVSPVPKGRAMRVFLIGYIYPPEVQSMGVMLQELAEDLTLAGHEVTVITGWPNHPTGKLFPGWKKMFRSVEQTPQGFRLVRCTHAISGTRTIMSRMWYYASFAISSYLNSLNLGPADVVVSMSTPIFGTWSAWMLARAKDAAFVYEIDDLHPEAARNAGLMREGFLYRTLRSLDRSLCRKSHAIVTLSTDLKRLIVDRNVSEDNVHIISFWIDTSKILPGPRDNAWRRSQGIPDETFVALYAGTIGLISGAEVLIEAAERLRDHPEILFLCVGEGIGKERLEAQAKEKALTNMRFLPFQPAEVLNDVFATADVGLVTLLPEAAKSSIPSKVLGYLAAGRSVIASVPEDCGTAEMVRAGECGLVVPCQDGAAIAEAVAKVAADREECRAMGARGRAHAEETYSRRACTKTYENLLMEMRDQRLGLFPGTHRTRKSPCRFTISPLGREHIWTVVDVHMRAFPNFFLTFMGPGFLRELYQSFTTDTLGVGYVAQAEDGTVLGSVIGPVRPDRYFRDLLKHRWWAFGIASVKAVLRRPGVAWRLLRAVRYQGDAPTGNSNRALLSSISVAPEAQGLGVGKALIQAWLEEAKRRGCSGAFLTTDAEDNEATNQFYVHSGWRIESTYQTREHRKMNRYVLDFPPEPAQPAQ